MGLFSKLLGGENSELGGLLKDIANAVKQESVNLHESGEDAVGTAEQKDNSYDGSPSGFSWGNDMPAEENQYNYKGSYIDYFRNIFETEFGSYTLDLKEREHGSFVFTFLCGGREALIVELMSERSCANKFRRECTERGIPYLRFYYDHHGWWNTRRYVTERVSKALA